MTGLLVIASGALGAVLRFAVAGSVQRRASSEMPVGTAAVNLAGAFLLGVAVGSGITGNALAAGAGLLAGLTTFSTWMVETVVLATEGEEGRWRAAANLAGVMALGLVLAWAGLEAGRLLG